MRQPVNPTCSISSGSNEALRDGQRIGSGGAGRMRVNREGGKGGGGRLLDSDRVLTIMTDPIRGERRSECLGTHRAGLRSLYW